MAKGHGISYLNAPGHTGETWNPVVGCSPASEGCANCYAQAVAHRGMCEQHRGLTTIHRAGCPQSEALSAPCSCIFTDENISPRWTGDVRLVPEALSKPLSWRKPRMVLAPSMGDLFHEDVPGSFVYASLGIMMASHQSTFLVPTKRIDAALTGLRVLESGDPARGTGHHDPAVACLADAAGYVFGDRDSWSRLNAPMSWPPKNVIIMPSVESQRRANERLPLLAEIAVMRWRVGLLVEPLLECVDLCNVPSAHIADAKLDMLRGGSWCPGGWGFVNHSDLQGGVEFVAVGAETGPRARPCKTEWIRDVVDQCKAARVRCHVKQLERGATRNPSEWPREFVRTEAGL